MQDYQKEFIQFAIDREVLRFGEFRLKSGRLSPYFFNSGLFNTGAALSRLGRYYALAIRDSGIAFDMLYGPAYKGIPLVAAVSIALSDHFGLDVPYAFNRKEAKDHGEGGTLVGAPLAGRVLIVDDVITAGTSAKESIDVIRGAGATVAGVAISLDRQERGSGELSAIQELQRDFDLEISSIISLRELIGYLEQHGSAADTLAAVRRYRDTYGIS